MLKKVLKLIYFAQKFAQKLKISVIAHYPIHRNPCNYDYKGSVILKNNQLGVLAKKKIEVIGAHHLTMEGNVFDVAESTDDDKAIDIHNVREVVVLNNR